MCVFCDIINGTIPSYKVYEDDDVLAILDISQVTKGHTLIISKKHYCNLLECDDDILTKMITTSKMLGNQLMKKLNANGMNILSNINEVAGQSVPHVHIHLIPRYSDNDACIIKFNESEKQDLETLLEIIKK